MYYCAKTLLVVKKFRCRNRYTDEQFLDNNLVLWFTV